MRLERPGQRLSHYVVWFVLLLVLGWFGCAALEEWTQRIYGLEGVLP